jgi:hypothetical protein
MKLAEIEFANVRSLPDGRYSLRGTQSGKPLDVVLVTGPARSGKTSFLEAIAAAKEAAGPYGQVVDLGPMRGGREGRGEISATWELSGAEFRQLEQSGPELKTAAALSATDARPMPDAALARVFGRFTRERGRGKFEYFPANRRVPLEPLSSIPTPISEEDEGNVRLRKPSNKYEVVARVLQLLALETSLKLGEDLAQAGLVLGGRNSDPLTPYREAIATMNPDLRFLGVDSQRARQRLVFQRRTGDKLELAQLSDSELQGVLFAVTFERLGLHHSIVLIDTPELHIHPAEHVEFMRRLVLLGQDNQIVAATSSRELLAMAGPGQIIDVGRTPQG